MVAARVRLVVTLPVPQFELPTTYPFRPFCHVLSGGAREHTDLSWLPAGFTVQGAVVSPAPEESGDRRGSWRRPVSRVFGSRYEVPQLLRFRRGPHESTAIGRPASRGRHAALSLRGPLRRPCPVPAQLVALPLPALLLAALGVPRALPPGSRHRGSHGVRPP